ncbi:hypothetical protein MSBRW_2275 [Methanosarcina barkeri str. Wiesmoor]|uniref:Uncharacterized protein n=2 Tax=Methanosarcina barkeri TaxID=2208 RepID=A0A0E3QMH5_METBA|nr:hypothetical protein MSBRW_2275 [Methanosarcina barkeri str. Wiesmoor]
MQNSASEYEDSASEYEDSASEFEDSHSDFAVYSSSGRLLQGSGRFKEVWEHSELAKQLDIKRSALYVEVRESELLLGCSLLVKIRKGREERAVFIECFPKEAVTESPGWINRFYADAKNRTEGLQSIRYQVIGLWKEEDIFSFFPPKSAGNLPDCLEKKVISREEISVWIPNLSNGIFLLTGLIFKLKSIFFPGFSLSLSLYPSQTNISAGPGELDPDFTFEGGKILASAAHDKKANLEMDETIGRVQKKGLKEYKDVFNLDDMSGVDFPKSPEEPSKKNKTWKKKKIAEYACCFFLFLIAGFFILSKAGLEPTFLSFNISKNNDTNFPPFRIQLEIRGDINSRVQYLRDKNTSNPQLPTSKSRGGGSPNLSSVNLEDKAENDSLELQDLIKETNNSSEVGNAGVGNASVGNAGVGNGTAGNESAENVTSENKNLENGIPENESNGYGILENKNVENEALENESNVNAAK